MRFSHLLFLVLWCNLVANAQPTYQRFNTAMGTATMNLETLPSGNILAGLSYASGISILDATGSIVHAHCFEGLPMTLLQSVRRHTEDEVYFVAGYLSDSCAVSESLEVDPVFGKMDSLGNVLSLYRYQLNAVTCSNTAMDLEVTGDGGAVVWGREDSFFAMRVDPTSMPMWSKQFDYNGSFSFIRELPSGDLLAGINMATAGGVVARLNADGDFLWCRSYMRPHGNVQDCVIESDTSFIITGYSDSIGSTNVTVPLPPDYQPK